jgi:hypothetical protein
MAACFCLWSVIDIYLHSTPANIITIVLSTRRNIQFSFLNLLYISPILILNAARFLQTKREMDCINTILERQKEQLKGASKFPEVLEIN